MHNGADLPSTSALISVLVVAEQGQVDVALTKIFGHHVQPRDREWFTSGNMLHFGIVGG